MPPQRRGLPRVVGINPHLVCHICDGYLVDATTVIECLHSFCRTCIVRYLESSKFCPVCDVQVHKTRPLLSIRSDQTLQDVVYKLVPGLYQNEMHKRRDFYGEHPEAGADLSPEDRGESDPRFISAQESVSLTLQHRSKESAETENEDDNNGEAKDPSTRYLSCPAAFTVGHLKKFLGLKFSLPSSCKVDVFYDEHLLRDESTLMDIAYIYSWKRAAPMKFFYSISKRAPKLVEPLPPPSPRDPQPVPCSELTKPVESAIDDEMALDVDLVSVSKKTEAESEDMDVDPVIPASESQEEVNPVILVSESKEEVKPTIPASKTKQIVEPVILTPEPMEEVGITTPVVVKTVNTEVTETVPIPPARKMDIEEPEVDKSNSSPNEKPTPLPIAEPTYNSVKLVSAPERNTLLSPTNGFRLKFIHDPQLNPKSQKSKKSGRKGGRSSRHKSVPVRLARLAPYPPPVPVTCLTTQPLQHLPQITVGKLVPTMITTLAPTIVTTLVSTTSSTLCNASHNSNAPQVASFINQPTTCNISTIANNFVSSVSKTVAESSIPSSSSTSNSLSCAHHVYGLASPSQNLCKDSPTNTKELSNSKSAVSTTCAIVVPQSMPSSIALSAPIHVVSSGKDSPKSNTSTSTMPLPPFVSPSMNLSNSKPVAVDNPVTSLTLTHSTTSVSCSSDIIRNSETASSSALVLSLNTSVPNSNNPLEQPSNEPMINSVSVANSKKKASSFTDNTDSIFKNANIDKKSESFKLSVKNSISAEFSDNDDLGCQPDLVVDEQKMDSSDIEDDTDTALRKKITAIAEKEEDEIDVTDDTEADSGVSCTAQSEDDHISIKNSETSTSTAAVCSVSSAATPNTSTTSSSDDNHRHIKSNNINDVIKHLYRQHEIGRPSSSSSASTTQPKPSTSKQTAVKDDSGVLDLSTCIRKPGEVHTFRQKPVANPVLDIKHRQQTYLPAPIKQHTVCPPAPKHNSSPLLLHHLTGSGSSSSSILHNQLTRNSKSPHHSASYSTNIQPFSLSSNRPIVSSPSSPLSGRVTPNTYTHKLSQGVAHPSSNVNFVPGMIPYASIISNMASYANRNNILNLQSPSRTSSITFPKDVSPTNVNSKMSYNNAKQTSTFTGRKPSDLLHTNSPNGRGSSLCPSPAPAHPRTSPSMIRMSPHHRSASPSPSPQHITPSNILAVSSLAAATTSSQSKPSVPIYKKQDNFKSYSHKFKGSSNLAVFNPDPNGYRQKIVIKKLDSQPNNHHS